MALGIIF